MKTSMVMKCSNSLVKWIDKIESAIVSGDWVYVVVDSQWINLIPTLVRRFRNISGQCKIWFICPYQMQNLLSNDIFANIICSNDFLEDMET